MINLHDSSSHRIKLKILDEMECIFVQITSYTSD